jgi:hypothetical protein
MSPRNIRSTGDAFISLAIAWFAPPLGVCLTRFNHRNSQGGRGTWRFITAYPEIAAAAVISAGLCAAFLSIYMSLCYRRSGVAERKGDFAMTEQPAPETIPLLYKIVDLPIKTCIGTRSFYSPALV